MAAVPGRRKRQAFASRDYAWKVRSPQASRVLQQMLLLIYTVAFFAVVPESHRCDARCCVHGTQAVIACHSLDSCPTFRSDLNVCFDAAASGVKGLKRLAQHC